MWPNKHPLMNCMNTEQGLCSKQASQGRQDYTGGMSAYQMYVPVPLYLRLQLQWWAGMQRLLRELAHPPPGGVLWGWEAPSRSLCHNLSVYILPQVFPR